MDKEERNPASVGSGYFLGFSPIKGKGKDAGIVDPADISRARNMAKQLHVYKPGIDFVPGAKLEVLDTRDDKWYQCKVVEVDWGELDILVHYERWSIRFDEWLKMDSSRIRTLSSSSLKKASSFRVGERVLAKWAVDGCHYEAIIKKMLPNGYCQILYILDNILKVVKISSIQKMSGRSMKYALRDGLPSEEPSTSAAVPECPSSSSVRKNIFAVEIIDEKRKPKRKPALEELLQSIKKKRKMEDDASSKKKTVEKDRSPKVTYQKSSIPVLEDVPLKSPEGASLSDSSLQDQDDELKLGNASLEEVAMPAEEGGDGESLAKSTVGLSPNCTKPEFDEDIKEEEPSSPADLDKTASDEKPLPVLAADVTDAHDLKEEAEELFSEKKVEITPLKEESEKAALDISVEESDTVPMSAEAMPTPSHPLKVIFPVTGVHRALHPGRRKFFLKKEPVLTGDAAKFETVDDYTCPKTTCCKVFRKMSLLQMHIKHYHPELQKKGKKFCINVADLAYARTVGDHLDDTTQNVCRPEQELPHLRKDVSNLYRGDGKSLYELRSSGRKATRHKFRKKHQSSDSESGVDENLHRSVDVQVQPVSADPDYVPSLDELAVHRKDRSSLKVHHHQTRANKRRIEFEQPENECHPPASEEARKNNDLGISAEVVEKPTRKHSKAYTSEVINCGCGSTEEEGFMLQCEVCQCWQHGECYNITDTDLVPDKYICAICENPRLERSSYHFRHHQDWLKEGKLPKLSTSADTSDGRLETCIKRSHDISANILQLSRIMSSLQLKLHIAQHPDHPKLVMWHKPWEDPPLSLGENSSPDGRMSLNDMISLITQQSYSSDNIPLEFSDGKTLFNDPIALEELRQELASSYNSKDNNGLISLASLGQVLPLNGTSESVSASAPKPASSSPSSESPLLESILRGGVSDIAKESSEFGTNLLTPEGKAPFPVTAPIPELSDTDADKSTCPPSLTCLDKARLGKSDLVPETKSHQVSDMPQEVSDLSQQASGMDADKAKGDLSAAIDDNHLPLLPDATSSEFHVDTAASQIIDDYMVKVPPTSAPEPAFEGRHLESSDDHADEKNKTFAIKQIEQTLLETAEKLSSETKGAITPSDSLLPTRHTLGTGMPMAHSCDQPLSDGDSATDCNSSEVADETARVPPSAEGTSVSEVPAVEEAEGGEDEDDDLEFPMATDLAALLASQPDLDHLLSSNDESSVVSDSYSKPVAMTLPHSEKIEPEACRVNLLKHMLSLMNMLNKRFDFIEEELKVLESEMGLPSEVYEYNEKSERITGPETVQARAVVRMLINDFHVVERLSCYTA